MSPSLLHHPLSVLAAMLGGLWLWTSGPAGLPGQAATPARERPVENFRLTDHRGRSHELHRYSAARAVVIVTVGNGCPIVRQSIGALKELREKFAADGVTFLLLNANPQDSQSNVVTEAEEFGIDFPVLRDTVQRVARGLGATRTAEAFAIDTKTWAPFYQGAIDDRLGYGTQKVRNIHYYLRDALESFVAGKSPDKTHTRAKGCAITFATAPTRKKSVSYTQEVVPILEGHCVSCHSPGGIGPFAMSSYEKVKGWSETIREVVLEQRMPPWHADPAHGVFSNNRSLSTEETRTLLAWIDQGAPRGGGQDALASRGDRTAEPWPLGKPDVIIPIPCEQVIPATGLQPYRYFIVEAPVQEDVWVRGTVLRPGNVKVLHHALVFLKYPEAYKDKQPKYNQGAGGYFAAYVPGAADAFFPEDTGKFLPKGTRIIFQMHYTPTGKEERDRTELGLYVLPRPPAKELQTRAAVQSKFEIPPGAADHEVKAGFRFTTDSLLYSLSPHMHLRGSRFQFEAEFPDGRRTVLLSVPHYDFNWQTLYELATPLKVPAGTRLVCTGAFDNSPQNPANPDATKAIRWGDQSYDEMFIGYLNFIELSTQTAQAEDATK